MSIKSDNMVSIVFRCKVCLRCCQSTQEFNKHFELHHIPDYINDSDEESNILSPTKRKGELEINKEYYGKPRYNEDSCSDDDKTEAKENYDSDADPSSDSEDVWGERTFLSHIEAVHTIGETRDINFLAHEKMYPAPTLAQARSSFRVAYWGALGRNEDNRSDDEDDLLDDNEKEVWTDNILDKERVESVILSTLSTGDGDAHDTNTHGRSLPRSPRRQRKRQIQYGNSISKKLKSAENISTFNESSKGRT